LFWLGDFRQGHRHLAQGIALYDRHQHRAHALHYGTDPGVFGLCVAGWTLWCLGYPEQALKTTQDGLRLAHEVAHAYTLAFALNTAGLCHQLRHEAAVVREQAEAGLRLAAEHGFAFRAAWAKLLQGWALAAQGRREEGVGRIQEGLAAQRATGTEAVAPYFLALQAEVYGQLGQPEAGLAALAEASAMIQRTGEQWYEAELYRLRGELTLQTKAPGLPTTVEEAEGCFHKAVGIARQQQAKSLELRAVMSLSRLWRQQGKRKEAHRLLSVIYGWFTEGFDTKDLQEAKALLDELAEAR
jgi:predicted ATPase